GARLAGVRSRRVAEQVADSPKGGQLLRQPRDALALPHVDAEGIKHQVNQHFLSHGCLPRSTRVLRIARGTGGPATEPPSARETGNRRFATPAPPRESGRKPPHARRQETRAARRWATRPSRGPAAV